MLRISLCVYAVAIVAAFIGLDLWFERNRKAKKLSAALIFSSFWATAGGGFLLVAIVGSPASGTQLIQNVLAGLAGAGLGWLLGMYISPIGSSEATAFQKYGTALAGVLSGYTLKSAVEFVQAHPHLIRTHAFPIAFFVISTLLVTAVVYNSRAYDNKLLEIHLKGPQPVIEDGRIKIDAGKISNFYAQITGPEDPTVRWILTVPDTFPPADKKPEISQCGVLNPQTTPTDCRLTAMSLEDPTLSNFVDLTIA